MVSYAHRVFISVCCRCGNLGLARWCRWNFGWYICCVWSRLEGGRTSGGCRNIYACLWPVGRLEPRISIKLWRGSGVALWKWTDQALFNLAVDGFTETSKAISNLFFQPHRDCIFRKPCGVADVDTHHWISFWKRVCLGGVGKHGPGSTSCGHNRVGVVGLPDWFDSSRVNYFWISTDIFCLCFSLDGGVCWPTSSRKYSWWRNSVVVVGCRVGGTWRVLVIAVGFNSTRRVVCIYFSFCRSLVCSYFNRGCVTSWLEITHDKRFCWWRKCPRCWNRKLMHFIWRWNYFTTRGWFGINCAGFESNWLLKIRRHMCLTPTPWPLFSYSRNCGRFPCWSRVCNRGFYKTK